MKSEEHLKECLYLMKESYGDFYLREFQAREYAAMFAIEQLNILRSKIVVEPEGNGFDEDVSVRSNERWRADSKINALIAKLKEQTSVEIKT